jgi:predicted DNA-binding transcriptional regulator AlpA
MDEGLRMEDMYSKLGATKSNFRRLMQKYNLSIRLPDSEPMFSEVKKFREEEINDANALYRKWGNIISY